jgi:thioredoxin reductase
MLGIDMAEQHAKIYDVVIIGAGPAGLSAAIYASRKNISTLFVAFDIGGELTDKGVVYCSTCDGPLFKDLSIAIVGGGNSGLEAALEMENIASKVYLISGGEWRGDQILQDKVAANQGNYIMTQI